MIKTFTENDLIRYVYGETSDLENTEIETTLLLDSELEEEVNDMNSLRTGLDALQISPSDSVIDKILRYSVSTV